MRPRRLARLEYPTVSRDRYQGMPHDSLDILLVHEVIDHRRRAAEHERARRLELRIGTARSMQLLGNLRHRQPVQRRIGAITGDRAPRQILETPLLHEREHLFLDARPRSRVVQTLRDLLAAALERPRRKADAEPRAV